MRIWNLFFVSFGLTFCGIFHGIWDVFAEEAIPAQENPKSETKIEDLVGYDKGFYIQSKDQKFKLVMGGYIQPQFSWQWVEDGGDTDTFRLRRARLKWLGHAFSKNIQYLMEYDLAGSKMLSAYLQLVAADSFKFRIGQYEVPFNFEGTASGSGLQFVDRSIAHSFFGVRDERDTGFGVQGELSNRKLEYYLSAFNGEAINTLNTNNELRYVGRLVFNALGYHGLEFSDVKKSKDPVLAFGVAGMFNDILDATTQIESKVSSVTFDTSAKYFGLGVHGAYFFQNTNPDNATSQTDHALLAQVGYFVIPHELEIAARVTKIFKEGTGDQGEYTLGLNFYLFETHNVKFQMDYSALTEEDGVVAGDDRLDHRVRAQLQVKI